MNFNHSEERLMLQDSLRRYLSDNYNAEKASSDAASSWQSLADLGVITALFDESLGGYGGTGFDLAVVFEEFGRAGVIEPFLETGVLAGGLIAELGNHQQKKILPKVMAGTVQLAFAHAERESRYELNRVATTAKSGVTEGGGFVLNGHKSVVDNGDAAEQLIVSARTGGNVDCRDGISLFLIDANTKGIVRRAYSTISGGRACEVILTDCRVPESSLLGLSGSAFDAIEHQVSRATTALCAEAVGAMDTAMSMTVSYLKERKQFGRPLSQFQALQHRMVDLFVEMTQARSAVINLAGHLDADRIQRERYVSAAKNLIGRVGRAIAEETIQLHGGMGMTAEYSLARFAKRLVMIDHQYGDTDHHLERFIQLSSYSSD
jgi:alkylation response protein AidB-like acyl-CoA dehydrogenase